MSQSFAVSKTTCCACHQRLTPPFITSTACSHTIHEACLTRIENASCSTCSTTFSAPSLEGRAVCYNEASKLNLLLHYVIETCGEEGIDEIENLLAAGASVSSFHAGLTPLYRTYSKDKKELMQLLVDKNADPTQKNNSPHPYPATPMAAAIDREDRPMIEWLLDKGFPLEAPCYSQRTPVFFAMEKRKEALVLFFIKKGADIEKKNYRKDSLLRLSILYKLFKVVQELVNRGVDTSEKAPNGHTLLHDAAESSPEILECLLTHGAIDDSDQLWLNQTPLCLAVHQHILENVQQLVYAGTDLTIKYHTQNILQVAQQYESNLNSNCKAIVNFLKEEVSTGVPSLKWIAMRFVRKTIRKSLGTIE